MTVDNEQQEIVLGNKQLLSLFFVVVVLLGVAFTIGYTIGKNTSVASAGNTAQTFTPSGTPLAAPASQPIPPSEEPSGGPIEKPVAATPTPKETVRQSTRKTAAPSNAIDPSDPSVSHKTVLPSDAPAATQASAPGAPYLQVAALKREDANHLVEVLRKRSFPALLGESPKPDLFRVLVGPFKTMQDLAESKQKLRAAGFDTIVAR